MAELHPVLVIGSGLAGLTVALEVAEGGRAVRLIAKAALAECNTRYAQGGIAVALAHPDSPALHARDTHEAGAGLCDEAAVATLTSEAPARFRDLLARGVVFDREGGELALTLEGAHSCRRVAHANGDATGAEVERALIAQVHAHDRIQVVEHAFALDLIVQDGACVGAWVLRPDGRLVPVPASSVVLATGGLGQLYRHTTNPEVATADGLAMAYRAGAAVRDMEFVQFHPTALVVPGKPTFLISEAVRGEGGLLRDASGRPFMEGVHPLKDLAPRDVVARAIARAMAADHKPYVWLDLSHLDPALVASRFPTIRAVTADAGIALPLDPIPVAPAAHYQCGGVVTDLDGRTTLSGLYAAGEVAWTGVHGANRLASNSLLECAVFGHRTARAVLGDPPGGPEGAFERGHLGAGAPAPDEGASVREALRELMWRHAGLVRTEAGLAEASRQIASWHKLVRPRLAERPGRALGELANMLTAAALIVEAARARRESRGCHWREDHPAASPGLRKHITLQRT